MRRSASSPGEKFLELRKSYRKLKTMKARNPDVKVSWKYFQMMDDIYRKGTQDVEVLEEMEMDVDDAAYELDGQTDGQEDDDFQCIIVMPEGEDVDSTQIMIQNDNQQNYTENMNIKTENKQIITKWNRSSKKQLLRLYLKYLKTHAGQEINSTEMWTEIASKMEEKTPITCKKMLKKLKNLNHPERIPYNDLLEIISNVKPKFKKVSNNDLDAIKVFKNVEINDDKVYKALQYYLQNLEDFISPKFEKKYLWTELAKYISEPVRKVFHKINYLKENFNTGIYSPFREVFQEILTKENALKDAILNGNDLPMLEEDDLVETWSDIEIERLLTWYLAHLDKFKNPKFVRSYLWMEASDILKKSPLVCSRKMLEIRSQYRTMVKESPESLESWKFYNLCQRIYGTGKKTTLEDDPSCSPQLRVQFEF